MGRLPRAFFPYARFGAPLLAALVFSSPSAASWLLAGATVAACLTRFPIASIIAAAQRREALPPPSPLPPSTLVAAGVGAAVTALLAYLGFARARAASDVALPVVLIGVLALLSSLLNLEGPGLVDSLKAASVSKERRAELRHGLTREQGRERIRAEAKANGEMAVLGAAAFLVIEISASLFAAAAFLVVALAGGGQPGWAWQGAGAFALALASSTASLAGAAADEEGSPLTNLGAPVLIAFVICAVAVSYDWTVMLAGAPMVFLAVLLVAVRPTRFPRVVDAVLTIATVATAAAVAWYQGP